MGWLDGQCNRVDVQVVGAQAPQRLLARAQRAAIGGVLRQYLGDDEDAFTGDVLDRIGDDLFRAAIAVHLRCVDVRHPELDAQPGTLYRGRT